MGSIFYVRPTSWELNHAHALKAAENYAESHDGVLPTNRFWRDLEFRYTRDAHAFSVNHPNFKLLLDRLAFEHAENHVADLIQCHDWTGCTRGSTEPPRLSTQAVPEPPSFVMGLTCVVAWFIAAAALAMRESRK